MGTISYTVADSLSELNPDFLYGSFDEATTEAKHQNCKAFRFEWDGIDPQTVKNVSEI